MARIDDREATRLHQAASYGDVEEMQRLVLAGYSVNALDSTGRTPLHHAIEGRKHEAARWLEKQGANAGTEGLSHGREEPAVSRSQDAQAKTANPPLQQPASSGRATSVRQAGAVREIYSTWAATEHRQAEDTPSLRVLFRILAAVPLLWVGVPLLKEGVAGIVLGGFFVAVAAGVLFVRSVGWQVFWSAFGAMVLLAGLILGNALGSRY